MTYDLTALKERTDLLALIGHDTILKRVASTDGGEWAGPCRRCGGKDRFHCTATWWFCRQCHEKRGDAIEYVCWRDGVGFREACDHLTGGKLAPSARLPKATGSIPAPQPMFAETEPPSGVWQARAREFVAYALGQLWQTPDALAYLRDRGLSDDTVRAAGLGYYDGPEREKNIKRWDVQGTYIWLPRGWVIPCESGGVLWYVKVRRHPDDLGPDPRTASGRDAKYQTLKGGRLTMYGLETLRQTHFTDCIICEGELDALLLRQHVGSLVGCVALGSATKGLDMQAIDQLVAIRRVWLALDADKAGQDGAKKLLAASARIHLLPVPGDNNDVTDAWQAGHDLVAWVVPKIGPRDRDRRLMWLKYHLDKLACQADADDDVWRVWQALLAEHNEMVRGQG